MRFFVKVSVLVFCGLFNLLVSVNGQDKVVLKDGTEQFGEVSLNEVNPVFVDLIDAQSKARKTIHVRLIKEVYLQNGDKYTAIKYKVSPSSTNEILGFALVEGDINLYKLKNRLTDDFIILKKGQELADIMLDQDNNEEASDYQLPNYKIILFQYFTSLSNQEKVKVAVIEPNLFYYTTLHNTRVGDLTYQKESLINTEVKAKHIIYVYSGVQTSSSSIETLNLFLGKNKYIDYNSSSISVNTGFEYYIDRFANSIISDSYILELNYHSSQLLEESTANKAVNLSEIELSLGIRLNMLNYKQFRVYAGFAPGLTYSWLSEIVPFKASPTKQIEIKSISYKNYTAELGIKVQPIATLPLELELYAQGINREHLFLISGSYSNRFDPMYVKRSTFGLRVKYAL